MVDCEECGHKLDIDFEEHGTVTIYYCDKCKILYVMRKVQDCYEEHLIQTELKEKIIEIKNKLKSKEKCCQIYEKKIQQIKSKNTKLWKYYEYIQKRCTVAEGKLEKISEWQTQYEATYENFVITMPAHRFLDDLNKSLKKILEGD